MNQSKMFLVGMVAGVLMLSTSSYGTEIDPQVQQSEREMLTREIEELNKMLQNASTDDEKKAINEKITFAKNRLDVLDGKVVSNTAGDTARISEKNALILEIERLNKTLSQAGSAEQTKAIIDTIAGLKQKLAALEGTGIVNPQVQQSEREMLTREIEELNKMLQNAANEEEKSVLTSKITLLKERLSAMGNVVTPWTNVSILSERESLQFQLQGLIKARDAAIKEEDKKLFASKIEILNARLAQLDLAKDSGVANRDTQRVIIMIDEIIEIDKQIMIKKEELTVAIKNGEKENVMVIERTITALMEKRKTLSLQTNISGKIDSTFFDTVRIKPDDAVMSKDARLVSLKEKYEMMLMQVDTLNKQIEELKIKTAAADSMGNIELVNNLTQQTSTLAKKVDMYTVDMEKIGIEAEQITNALQFQLETEKLRDVSVKARLRSDSLLALIKEKNQTRSVISGNSEDAESVASLTNEILSLKEEYLKETQMINAVRQEIHESRVENLIVKNELRTETVPLVVNEIKNSYGLYEVTMDKRSDDTAITKKVQVKLNVTEQVAGEVEITEEIIDQAPDGKKGLIAFDITPSVDLLINMKDAEIELPFDPAMTNGYDVEKLVICYFDVEKGWVPVEGCRIDAERKVVIANVTHFSVYGVFADEAVSINVHKRIKPQELTLSTKNVHATIVFDFILPEKSYVQLHIFDLSGKLVARPVSGMYKEGTYSLLWNACESYRSYASAGKYIAKLNTRNAQITKTFTLVR